VLSLEVVVAFCSPEPNDYSEVSWNEVDAESNPELAVVPPQEFRAAGYANAHVNHTSTQKKVIQEPICKPTLLLLDSFGFLHVRNVVVASF
jgi:hypothetical protein